MKFLLVKLQPIKMVKYTQTIRRQHPANFLSVFDHFVGLGLKGLKQSLRFKLIPPVSYRFSKNVLSRYRVKPCFHDTFNIACYVFPENFIGIYQSQRYLLFLTIFVIF